LRSFCQRKIHFENGADPEFAVDIDVTVMLFENPVCDRQTQPGPFAHLFCREKRIEDFVAGFLIHAGAGVGYRDECVVPLPREGVVLDVQLVKIAGAGCDGELSAVGHGVTGIGDEVDDDLLDCAGIHFYGKRRFAENGRQRNIRRNQS